MMHFAFALSVLTNPTGSALRQTRGSNVEVVECSPHRHISSRTAHPWVDPYGIHHGASDFPMWDGFLSISYRNQAPITATEIDFGLVVRHSLIETATDVGVFSHGALIEHEFAVSREIFPVGAARPYCAVLRVKYADGSEWYNPRAPQD